MATHTDYLVTPTQSATGTLKRSVADTIRHNWPGTPFLQLVSTGVPKQDGDVIRQKGLIGKRRVATPKYEAFSFLPLGVEYLVSTGGTTSIVMSDATGIRPKSMLLNTKNKTYARVSAVSTNTLTMTSVGDTSFSAAANDYLLLCGPAYEENSTDPYILMKDPDNHYNFTQTMRFATGVSRIAEGNPHFGGHRYRIMKEEAVIDGLRKTNNTMYFGERASGTNEKTTDATLSDTFATCRGIWNWAQTSFDAGGNLTHDAFLKDLPLAMHNSVGQQTDKIFVCGTEVWASILGWINDKLVVNQNTGKFKQFGVESTDILTAKGAITVVVDDAFNQGELSKVALVFCPAKIDYVHLRQYDFKPNSKNMAENARHGRYDEINGEVSVCPWDGGYSITKVIRCN